MNELVLPSINYFGENCIAQLGTIVSRFNGTKALIITDANLEKFGFVDKVGSILEESGIPFSVYAKVSPNPTKTNVYGALDVYQKDGCDFIVGLGGGSPNDCAKAVGILAANGGIIEDYAGGNKSSIPSVPSILINTTAGTGSEISRAYLISDEEKGEKIIAKDINALPVCSMNDPDFMVNLPASVTAATGMDALSHAVESYVAKGSNPLTRAIALEACRFVFSSLREVIANPHNIELRERMIYAEFLGTLAFGNSGVGIDHALSHALGATCHLPHGLCCAVFLPSVLNYNRRDENSAKLYAELSRGLFPFETNKMTESQAIDYLEKQIEKLSEECGTKRTLSSFGCFEESMIPKIAAKASRDGNVPRNPIVPTVEEFEEIIRKVL